MNRGARLASALLLTLAATPRRVAHAQTATTQPPPADASASANPSPSAGAMSPGLALEWQAPAGCPGRAALLVELAQVLGRPLRDDDPPLRARGLVRRTARGVFRLELETMAPGGAGQRVVSDRSCAHLTSAAALVLALTIDESARAASAPPPVPPPPTPPANPPENDTPDEPPPEPPAPPPPPPVPAPRPALLRSLGVRLSALFDVGTLPAIVAPGLGLTAALELGPARLEAGGAYWFAGRRDAVSVGPGVGVEVSMAAAQLRGCFVPRFSARVELGACGGFEAGAQFGQGVGNSAPASGEGPWAAGLAGAFFEWRVRPPLVLHLGVDGVFALTAPGFAINDEVVHRASVAAVRGTLGVGVHFR